MIRPKNPTFTIVGKANLTPRLWGDVNCAFLTTHDSARSEEMKGFSDSPRTQVFLKTLMIKQVSIG